jgi:hypothetical protein
MRMLSIVLLTGLTGLGWADTITLRDGRVVNGTYLGGDSRTVRFAGTERVETFGVDQILNITFGDSGQINSAPPPEARRELAPRPGDRDMRREMPPQGPSLAAGTRLVVRMIDSVDSQRDAVGQSFRASLDEPVVDSNGNTIVPRGADVNVKLIDDKQSGKLAGRTVLTLSLASVMVNGRMVDVNTMNITEQSSSRTARSGKVIGGTAAAGAIIGAIAGGGKGAAIGAGAGAGAGTVAEVATKGQKVHIPSETRLTFTLQAPVQL